MGFGKTAPPKPQDSPFGGGWHWGWGRTTSGANVNPQTALSLSVHFGCLKVLSEDTAKVPLEVFHYGQDGKSKIRHRGNVERLFNESPNAEMTAFSFRQLIIWHALGYGNFYAEIERDIAGRAVALWPIEPERVSPMRYESNNQFFYRVMNRNMAATDLMPEQMFHVPGFSHDGRVGVPSLSYMSETLGEGMAMRDYSAAFFGNDATPGFALTTEAQLTDSAFERMQKFLNERHRGAKNSHKAAVFEQGIKPVTLAGNNDQAQFNESRAFNVTDILRFYRVPAHKVAHLVDATYSNIESMERVYAQDAIAPWVTKIEQEIDRKLFGQNRLRYFSRTNLDELTRGDMASRYEAYQRGRQGGWLNADDIRGREDMNPIGGIAGETYAWPSNAIPADKAYDQAQINPAMMAKPSDNDEKPPAKKDDSPEEKRTLNVASVEAGFKRLLVAASKRCYRREARWAERQAKKTKSLAADLGEYLWSEGNTAHCRSEFEPVVTAISDAINVSPGESSDRLDGVVEAHLTASYRLLTAGKPDPDMFDEAQAEAAIGRLFFQDRIAA